MLKTCHNLAKDKVRKEIVIAWVASTPAQPKDQAKAVSTAALMISPKPPMANQWSRVRWARRKPGAVFA